MIWIRCWPLLLISFMYSRYWGDPSGPSASEHIMSENPMIAFSGVRSSWLIFARNSVFARFAASAS